MEHGTWNVGSDSTVAVLTPCAHPLWAVLQDQLEMLKLVALDPTKKQYASAEALKMYMESTQHNSH